MRFASFGRGVFVAALAVIVCAAPAARTEKGARTLEEKKWALQFGIRRDLTLGAFEGGSVSFKQRLSRKSALRYGAAIHYGYSDMEGEHHDTRNELFVNYQRYVNPDATAEFYWGTGPYMLISYGYRMDGRDDRYEERIEKQWGAGWCILGGVEWFVTDVISLADFQLFGLSYNGSEGMEGYNGCCDFNDDGSCTQTDFAFFAEHYLH